MQRKLVQLLAIGVGLLITYIDSRPNWDDTGVTAFAILAFCGLFGALQPDRPWPWALAVGGWIPMLGMLHGNLGGLLALPFAFVEAYSGKWLQWFLRRMESRPE